MNLNEKAFYKIKPFEFSGGIDAEKILKFTYQNFAMDL